MRFSQGRTDSILCIAVAMQPASRLGSVAEAKAFLDSSADAYGSAVGVTIPKASEGGGGGGGGGMMMPMMMAGGGGVGSEEMKTHQSSLRKMLVRKTLRCLVFDVSYPLFIIELSNDHFTKTGSRHTQGKHSHDKVMAFSLLQLDQIDASQEYLGIEGLAHERQLEAEKTLRERERRKRFLFWSPFHTKNHRTFAKTGS